MPGDRDDEICQKALELLSDLCSKGEVHNDNCLDFIYYFRDLARPRYTDSGKASFNSNIASEASLILHPKLELEAWSNHFCVSSSSSVSFKFGCHRFPTVISLLII